MRRTITLTFVDEEFNLRDDADEKLTDRELAARAAGSLAEILAQEKNPLDYFDWKVEVKEA